MVQQAVDWQNVMSQQAQRDQQAQPQQQQAPASPEQMMQQAIQGDPNRLSQIAQFLTQSANLGYDGQKASLGQARDNQITQLEKSYAQAVNDGAMSVKEAEKMFQAELENINKNAYLDNERSQLVAQDRGIQNSQQMMGLMATDNQRKNTLINTAISERDGRINSIKDRISQIGLQKDLDITSANSNYDYTLAGQRAQLGQGLLGQMYGMANDDYAQRQQALGQFAQMGMQNQYQLGQMDLQNQFDMSKLSQQQQYQLEQMAVNQGYNLESMGMQNQYDLNKLSIQQQNQLQQFAVQHGYNLETMNVQQVHQLAQMATQNGYNVGMENLSSANQFNNSSALNQQQHQLAMKEAEKKSQLAIAEETKAYDLAVQRELAKFKPGTKEYEIRAGQLETERQGMINELITQAQVEASIQYNLGTPIAEPTKPKRNWYQTDSSWKKEKAEYDASLEKFDAYQRALQDPMSMFPREAGGGAGVKW